MITKEESEFHTAMLDIYKRAKQECHYNAQRFLQMITEQGGLKAAKSLLHASGYSDGFTKLWECGKLRISMEALVLQEKWKDLFTVDELAVAEKRLKEHGYDFKS